MIRHILLWKYADTVKATGREDEAFALIQNSADTMRGQVEGLLRLEMARELSGNGWDFVYYTEFDTAEHLAAYQDHPLHVAHRQRCTPYLKERMALDFELPLLRN